MKLLLIEPILDRYVAVARGRSKEWSAKEVEALLLKLREEIFEEVERVVHAIRIPRNTYINQALDFYTRLSRRKLLKRQLQQESRAVRMNSLRVLKEFERLEDDLPA